MSYLAPTDLNDAFAYLAETGARIVAGCTDHYPSRQPGDVAQPILDITRLDGFRGISEAGDHWRIGAATTWTDTLKAPLPPAFDSLKQAAREVGSVQIQNRATIAGNLCNASPAADGVPPLLTLDASVEICASGGSRRVPLDQFITGVRRTALKPGELVSALIIPAPSDRTGSAFLKLGSRTHLVISIAMVAASIEMDADVISGARVAVGSCAPVAQRLPALEQALLGQGTAEIAAGDFADLDVWDPIHPIDDVRGSADYRRAAVATLTQRCILRTMG